MSSAVQAATTTLAGGEATPFAGRNNTTTDGVARLRRWRHRGSVRSAGRYAAAARGASVRRASRAGHAALSESTCPRIGSRTTRSHCSRTSRCRPFAFAADHQHEGEVEVLPRRKAGSPCHVDADHPEPLLLQFVQRPGQVRDLSHLEVFDRARRGLGDGRASARRRGAWG